MFTCYSCTAEVVVLLNEGLEQTCKLAKKESRKASFKCFKDPLREINNEYIHQESRHHLGFHIRQNTS